MGAAAFLALRTLAKADTLLRFRWEVFFRSLRLSDITRSYAEAKILAYVVISDPIGTVASIALILF